MWFSLTATYNFLSVEDANEDKVLDVFFMYKDADASRNTCLSEGKLKDTCKNLLTVGFLLWNTDKSIQLLRKHHKSTFKVIQ